MGDTRLSTVYLTLTSIQAIRANFAEWENVHQADWEDDEVGLYMETAVMENEMDILAWWKSTKTCSIILVSKGFSNYN